MLEVAVEGPLVVNTKEMAIRAAEDGVGVAFAPEYSISAQLADGRLIGLLGEWSAPFPGYHLCYPQQRQMAPAVRAFIDALRTQASGVAAAQGADARAAQNRSVEAP